MDQVRHSLTHHLAESPFNTKVTAPNDPKDFALEGRVQVKMVNDLLSMHPPPGWIMAALNWMSTMLVKSPGLQAEEPSHFHKLADNLIGHLEGVTNNNIIGIFWNVNSIVPATVGI